MKPEPPYKCIDCTHLRTDIRLEETNAPVIRLYGQFVNPCNRFPQNILRHPHEPACGELNLKERT